MNWLPKDKATWGFWISIFTLFVAVPFGIVANLLTPKIRDWWAARSRRSLAARIEVLESELTESEITRSPNELSTNILRMVTIALVFLWLGVHMILWACPLG